MRASFARRVAGDGEHRLFDAGSAAEEFVLLRKAADGLAQLLVLFAQGSGEALGERVYLLFQTAFEQAPGTGKVCAPAPRRGAGFSLTVAGR